MPSPLLRFSGTIQYACTQAQVEHACQTLIDIAERLPGKKQLLVGFDMEWEYLPTEKPPALIQLCHETPCTASISQTAALPLWAHTLPSDSPTHAALKVAAVQVQGASAGTARKRQWSETQSSDPAVLCQGLNLVTHALAQQTSTSAVNASVPAEAPSMPHYVCHLLHLARLGPTGADRAPLALKALLQHPRVLMATAGDRDQAKLEQDLGISADLQQVNDMHFMLQDELQQQQQQAAQRVSVAAAGSSATAPAQSGQLTGIQLSRKASKRAAKQRQVANSLQAGRSTRERRIALHVLVGKYLAKRLDKALQKSSGVWEAQAELSAKHQMYAATDALAHLLVFKELHRLLRAAWASVAAKQCDAHKL